MVTCLHSRCINIVKRSMYTFSINPLPTHSCTSYIQMLYYTYWRLCGLGGIQQAGTLASNFCLAFELPVSASGCNKCNKPKHSHHIPHECTNAWLYLVHCIISQCVLYTGMHETHVPTSTMPLVQESSRMERTLETLTLSLRWMPAQEMQRNTPRLMEAHSGSILCVHYNVPVLSRFDPEYSTV